MWTVSDLVRKAKRPKVWQRLKEQGKSAKDWLRPSEELPYDDRVAEAIRALEPNGQYEAAKRIRDFDEDYTVSDRSTMHNLPTPDY